MIFTTDIEAALPHAFSLDAGPGSRLIVLYGSCRLIPILNWFNEMNLNSAAPMTIRYIEPRHFEFSNETVFEAIAGADVVIHEHYAAKWDALATDRDAPRNIWQHGEPPLAISIPNFNAPILYEDVIAHDETFKALVGNVGEDELVKELRTRGEASIESFYRGCRRSDCPYLEQVFSNTWKDTRLFWTINHVSRDFSRYVFMRISALMAIEIPPWFWAMEAQEPDMFAEPATAVRDIDREAYGIKWG